MRNLYIITACIILTACQVTPQALIAETPTGYVEAAYVLYTQTNDNQAETVPLARVILKGLNSHCPQLIYTSASGDHSIAMSTRRNPDPINFPVTVCEALYPYGQSVKIAGTSTFLPIVR
ncbi:hypothetical protein [Methyloprofundus sp.]|uniref:hypothetical protein n=1 Tax=Methyloprofundus sp. TaxID=2020875 RepID=UPI003D0F65F4